MEQILYLRRYRELKDLVAQRVAGTNHEEIPDSSLLREVLHNIERLALEQK